MIPLPSETEIPSIDFPLNDKDVLGFVDYTILLLAGAETPADLDYSLDAFLAPPVQEYIRRHADNIDILASIWINAAERIIFNGEIKAFPVRMLQLAVLFKEWQWKVETPKHWQELLETIRQRLASMPCDHADYFHNVFALLFCDSMDAPLSEATNKMLQLLQASLPSETLAETCLAVGMLLGSAGWEIDATI